LKIIVRNIPEDGLKFHFTNGENWHRRILDNERGMDFSLEATSVDGSAEKSGDTVTLSVEVRTAIGTQCGRCLEPLIIPVNSEFKYTLIPVPEKGGEPEVELSLDELNIGYYKEDEIDLEPITLEQVVLQIPIKPLCSEACKGLCPSCGADLNSEPCECRADAGDLRFVALKNFKVMGGDKEKNKDSK
jgi:uncharacterized protein